MKKILLLSFLVLVQFRLFSQTTVFDTISSGGLLRDFRIHIPPVYDGTEAVPLLLNLHGYTSDNFGQALYANFNPIADTAGFITVLPNGTIDVYGFRFWNCFIQPGIGVDDVQFLSELIDSISAEYNIDQNRIYSTGMSNGGFMSHALACELSGKIAAIAAVAGSIDESRLPYCDAQHNTPVMQIHGTEDETVPFNGNEDFLPVDSVINYWVSFNHCNTLPTFTAVPDIVTTDNCTAEHYVYGGCYKNVTVELFKIIDGGHTWPGSAITFIGVTNLDINACKEIWNFFSRYRLDELTGIEDEHSIPQESITVQPNPVVNTIHISSTTGTEIYELELYDFTGRRIFSAMQFHNNDVTITIPDISQGIYFIVLKTSEGNFTQQIVKN